MPQQDVSIARYFADLPDPRVDRTKKHCLADMLVIALCAVIAGADSWEEVVAFGQAKEDWLKGFLALPNGIPSHDTFYRVFARLDPRKFGACVAGWMAGACEAAGLRHSTQLFSSGGLLGVIAELNGGDPRDLRQRLVPQEQGGPHVGEEAARSGGPPLPAGADTGGEPSRACVLAVARGDHVSGSPGRGWRCPRDQVLLIRWECGTDPAAILHRVQNPGNTLDSSAGCIGYSHDSFVRHGASLGTNQASNSTFPALSVSVGRTAAAQESLANDKKSNKASSTLYSSADVNVLPSSRPISATCVKAWPSAEPPCWSQRP